MQFARVKSSTLASLIVPQLAACITLSHLIKGRVNESRAINVLSLFISNIWLNDLSANMKWVANHHPSLS